MTNDANEGALMAQEQPIPFWPIRPFELVTVAVLRRKAWLELNVKNIVDSSRSSEVCADRHTSERNVRRLLRRLESIGVVRRRSLNETDYWQWNLDAPTAYITLLEEACATHAGRYEVPPVAQAPEKCGNGHPLNPEHVLQTGILVCDTCNEFVM